MRRVRFIFTCLTWNTYLVLVHSYRFPISYLAWILAAPSSLSRKVLENELDQVYAALQKAERDLIEAATHGMRLLEENQKLAADASKAETAAQEREAHLRFVYPHRSHKQSDYVCRASGTKHFDPIPFIILLDCQTCTVFE